MIANKEEQYRALIAPVHFYMQLSRKAYSKYLVNKILLHALNINSANRKIVELLENNTALIPDELLYDAIELLNHYGIWMNQFQEFRSAKPFELKDIFVFHHLDDQSAFPKEAEKRFLEYYTHLKKEISL